EDDQNIETTDISYPSGNEKVKAYLAHPVTKNKTGAAIVIHENRGLNAHIKDVTRRVAKAGYLALGVDALSPFGGTPEDEDEGRRLISELNAEDNLRRYLDAVSFLKNHPYCNGNVGCVGFCWGGGMANQIAANAPDLEVAVAYYGRQADIKDVPRSEERRVGKECGGG